MVKASKQYGRPTQRRIKKSKWTYGLSGWGLLFGVTVFTVADEEGEYGRCVRFGLGRLYLMHRNKEER